MFGLGKRGLGNGRGRRHRHRCDNCHINRSRINLNEAEENKRYIVFINQDKKTIELGMYVNSIISVQKNDPNEQNIVVRVGESRYIIPRDIAKNIIVK